MTPAALSTARTLAESVIASGLRASPHERTLAEAVMGLTEPTDDALLRKVLDAGTTEPTIDAARRVVDELIEWRGGCEGAFRVITASPRTTLVGLASSYLEHHRWHHRRERTAWAMVSALALASGAIASERAAAHALAELDEQGEPSW